MSKMYRCDRCAKSMPNPQCTATYDHKHDLDEHEQHYCKRCWVIIGAVQMGTVVPVKLQHETSVEILKEEL